MTMGQEMAKALIYNVGYEMAVMQAQLALERAMERGSIKDIEMQHFWRETLVEIMRARH